MHQDADTHQPLRRPREPRPGPARHDAELEELLRIRRPEAGLRRPAPDAEIAQAARAILEVRLEQEDRVAEAAVPFLLLGPKARDEVLRRRLRDPGPERGQELVGE